MRDGVSDIFWFFQLLLPLKTQEDLDQAVLTLSSSSGANGLLRILLKTPKNNHVSFTRSCTSQRNKSDHWSGRKFALYTILHTAALQENKLVELLCKDAA